jgi:hypothetical protein
MPQISADHMYLAKWLLPILMSPRWGESGSRRFVESEFRIVNI